MEFNDSKVLDFSALYRFVLVNQLLKKCLHASFSIYVVKGKPVIVVK